MTTYHAFLRGEDQTEFTIEVEAADPDAAYDWVQEAHPECHILEIFEPYARAEAIYQRQQAIYDNPDLDDFDY